MIDKYSSFQSHLPDHRRASAPIRHGFNQQQEKRHNSVDYYSNQPYRLSIAERFMSSKQDYWNYPSNVKINIDDQISMDSSPVHPHSLVRPDEVPNETDTSFTLHQKNDTDTPLKYTTRKSQCSTQKTKRNYSQDVSVQTTVVHNKKSSSTISTTTEQKKSNQVENNNNNNKTDQSTCCHRGFLLLCVFFFILVFGIVLFLIWPRVPLFRIEGASLVTPVEIVQTRQGWMENVMFTTRWLVNVTVDNRQNYIPTRLNKVEVIVKDALTNALIGKGARNNNSDDNATMMDVVLIDDISTVSFLVNVNYQARDTSDTTFLDLTHACHRTVNSSPSLPLHFWFTLYMFGFDWLGFTPTIIATPASSGFICPI
ncbi:uncharacterized protein BX664DRAFT_296711 [Halteromyces radiatus]|uniref:uncharacterized protein n=1 Tax=Halteromyces radiatus TaxID=101107 RepID=UPI00221EEFBF|nr:uncharacterized protein BX664DRAFT_296711 [Halteromyces radiatus]KAI8089170.1 hypothetical protein BX664DRAFT_296711 [Halteromyces radiatus]